MSDGYVPTWAILAYLISGALLATSWLVMATVWDLPRFVAVAVMGVLCVATILTIDPVLQWLWRPRWQRVRR